MKGLNYYRLKQVDNSGVFTYSKIRVLNFDNSTIQVYPNPNNGVYFVDAPSEGLVEVYDLSGKKVMEITLSRGLNTIDSSKLSEGVYTLTLPGSGISPQKLVIVK